MSGRFLLFFLFSFSGAASALEIPPAPQTYVSDFARLLSPDARGRLENLLREFETRTSSQMMVATFPGLEGESLEDYSIRLAEAWKPGQKGKDNGVILLIFKEERAVRIEVGYGLEGVLTDAAAKLIIENEIIPSFRQGNFDEGVERGARAILAATQGEYEAPPSRNPAFDWVPFIALMVWMGFYFYLRSKRRYGVISRSGYYGGRTRWGGGDWGGGGFSGGGGSFGGGGASGRW